MTKKVKHIVIPKWLSKKKDDIGPRIKRWHKKNETEKAILINLGGDEGENEYWLPKSQITYDEFETHTLDEHQKTDEDAYEEVYPGIEMMEE